MENEIRIDFPGSSLDDSAFYEESSKTYEESYNEYEELNDGFVQEFTLAELMVGGVLAAYLAGVGKSIYNVCAGGKRVYKFAALMVEASKAKDAKATAKYLQKLINALNYAANKGSLTASEKDQLLLTTHIGYALWYCMRNPAEPFVKETTSLFEKYMESCLKILAKPSKGRTPETVDLGALTSEKDED